MTEAQFFTEAGGFRKALSADGSLTGQGGDVIIIDDPIRPVDVLSDKPREKVIEWYRSTVLSRLNDKRRSVLILVMQRLHANDLTGYLESRGGFEKLSLPAIAMCDEVIPIGQGRSHQRQTGEALHPELEDLTTLERIRDEIGPLNFAAQYQQVPELPDGYTFKKKYLRVVGPSDYVPSGGHRWISIDAAASTSEKAHQSAIVIGHSTNKGHFVLDSITGHWDFEMLVAKTEVLLKRFPGAMFIVEAASNGLPLIPLLRRRGIHCISCPPKYDKVTRAALALPAFLMGRVFFVRQIGRDAWLDPMLGELLGFPHGAADDQVDALVQAIRWADPIVAPLSRVTVC